MELPKNILVPKIQLISTGKIIVDNTNPNIMGDKSFEALKKNIERYGFIIPVITNKDYKIADGYHRWKAARELGITEVPVIALDLEEVDRRMLRQILNKLRGEHDIEMDAVEYQFFLDEGQGELFDELNAAMSGDVEEDDFVPDLEKEPKYEVNKGDVYTLGDHRLMCGDSTIKEDVDKLMDGNKAILMVTDPPYGVEYDASWRQEAAEKGHINYGARSVGKVNNDDRIDWSDAYKLFNGDVCYVWHAGKYAKEVAESILICGFEIISQIIWVKPHFAISRGDYHWQHEPCWYANRKGKKHNWQGSRKDSTTWEINNGTFQGGKRDQADKPTGHSTQKPIECMGKPITNNSGVGEGVYDPFGGSGSTLIAAEQLNRKCYMMELDPKYCSVIIERWETLTGEVAEKIGR